MFLIVLRFSRIILDVFVLKYKISIIILTHTCQKTDSPIVSKIDDLDSGYKLAIKLIPFDKNLGGGGANGIKWRKWRITHGFFHFLHRKSLHFIPFYPILCH